MAVTGGKLQAVTNYSGSASLRSLAEPSAWRGGLLSFGHDFVVWYVQIFGIRSDHARDSQWKLIAGCLQISPLLGMSRRVLRRG